MEERNNKQDINIAKLQADIEWIRKDLSCLKSAVTNHLPTQIKDLNDRFSDYREKQGKWLIGILVSILLLLLGIIVNIIISL